VINLPFEWNYTGLSLFPEPPNTDPSYTLELEPFGFGNRLSPDYLLEPTQ